jgi:hypothetical protein
MTEQNGKTDQVRRPNSRVRRSAGTANACHLQLMSLNARVNRKLSETAIRGGLLLSFVFAASLWGGYALIPLQAGAAIITVGPSDCSAAAVNAAIATAADGDTVRITGTGTVTWSATVTLPSTKGIRLIGPGTNTPKGAASFPLVIISNAKPAISIIPENGRSLYQVSGFKFQNPNLSSDFSGYWYNSFISVRGRGLGSGGLGCYRIDNNYFDHVGNDTMIGLDGSTGELTGVVDNNTFLDVGQRAVVYVIRIRETWKGTSSSCNGADAWQRDFAFGNGHFHFIEDNLFSRPTTEGRHDISCDGAGGKFVVRYNTFNRSYGSSYQLDYVDAHGEGTPGLGAGTRGGEIYGNTFQGSGSAVYRDVILRGGQWLVYDNTFPSYGYLALTEYRASGTDCSQIPSASPCNPGVPQCAGPGDFSTWYPLPGQIRGTYFWNNIYNSANLVPGLSSENYVGTYIRINRDYWVSASKPAGLSNYKAFTYPHPLRSGAITLPAAPRISALNADPRLHLASLQWEGIAGKTYEVQVASNLLSGFQAVAVVTNNNSVASWQDAGGAWGAPPLSPTSAQRYYRIRQISP